MQPGVAIGQGDVGELVEEEPHRHRQAAPVDLVRLEVQLLERLGVEHPHQEVEGVVVAVGDDAENSLLALPQLSQLQGVPGGDVLDFRQGEHGKPHGGADQNGAGGLARRLLEDVVLPHGDVVRLLLLQGLEQQVQGGLIILVLLAGPAVLQHGEEHFQSLFLRGRLMEEVEHEGRIQSRLRLLPERV